MDWSSEEPEEEQEEMSKTSWLLLNQDPEQKEVEPAPVVADIQDQIHV